MDNFINLNATDRSLQFPNLNLIYIKKSRVDKGWHSTLHVHPFAEFFYVLHGKGTMKFQDRTSPLLPNDLLIVNSKVPHTEISDKEEPLEYIVLGLDGLSIHPFIERNQGNNDLSMYDYLIRTHVFHKNLGEKGVEFKIILKRIMQEDEEKTIYYEAYLHCLLQLLLLTLLRLTKSKLVLKGIDDENKHLEYIKSYLDLHYASEIDLDDLSNLIFMNKYSLVREFKNAYDTTPMDYLLNRRLDVSKDLLVNTDHSIEKIAGIVGFNSASYFSQIFKKKIGKTPSSYRKTARLK